MQIRDACVELERRINQTVEEYWDEELKGRKETVTSWEGANYDDLSAEEQLLLENMGYENKT